MALRERQTRERRRIPPSFSSSLLETIYHSIDEPTVKNAPIRPRTRNHAPPVEEDAESLRRAIIIASRGGHFPSNSGSSTDSSASSSTETDSSASKSTPRSLPRKTRTAQTPPPPPPVKVLRVPEAKPKRDGKSASVKSRAQKIYGDMKKAREPNSPGGRIASFLNYIFNPRSLKSSRAPGEGSSSSAMKSGSLNDTRTTGSVMKSRSVNDTKAKESVVKSRSINDCTKTTASVMKSRSVNDTKTHSRSCLSRSQFSRGNNNINSKSRSSVRFGPVSVIVDEDSAPSVPTIGSRYIQKNIDSIRLHELRDCYYNKKNRECDFDEMSCASSDLFELETNVVEELPVYGSTSYRIIAGELVM